MPGTHNARWKGRTSAGLVGVTLTLLARCLTAQAPLSHAPVSDQLPRFTLRQLVIERNDSASGIPSRWLRAGKAAYPDSLALESYKAMASRAGVRPLTPAELVTDRSQHVMALYRRAEVVEACRRALEQIRTAIPSESTRAEFDLMFRPQGFPVVDLHDAALSWAKQHDPGLELSRAWPALEASHWVRPGSSGRSAESIHRALYGLAVLAGTDSSAFAEAERTLWRADSSSAAAVLLLIKGYGESRSWYAQALTFFLTRPWIPEGGGRSIQDLVREEWRDRLSKEPQLTRPEIQPRWFGYPQAVPHYSVPPQLFARLVRPENPEAAAWLSEQGQEPLLRSLRLLPAGDSGVTLVRTRSETFRLTTASRQARESLNGFLEPRDAIAIDPGYSPLLAIGALVHEWQHLLFRRYQLEQFAARLKQGRPPMLRLPQADPVLAEGFAEWSAERILHSLVERWPILAMGELEKRAGLVQGGVDDQHVTGYALVRAVAEVLRDPNRTSRLLLRFAESPSRLLTVPQLTSAWARFSGPSRRGSRNAPLRLLIPEVSFTLEDGYPDVVSTRILIPGLDAPAR